MPRIPSVLHGAVLLALACNGPAEPPKRDAFGDERRDPLPTPPAPTPTLTLPGYEKPISLDARELDLSGGPIADADLSRLAALKNLSHLKLNRTGITDAGLKELRALKNLTT